MSGELPDFHIDHREKIEWMVETQGWALEPVAARLDVRPPVPGYAYTIGFPNSVQFPDVVIFGLTPVAARGLCELVAEVRRGGADIPLGVPLAGLLDNGLRCVFAPVEPERWSDLFTSALRWYGDQPLQVVQLLWPDRNGFLPYEVGFDRSVQFAQPVIGEVADEP